MIFEHVLPGDRNFRPTHYLFQTETLVERPSLIIARVQILGGDEARVRLPLPQPHARPAAVLRDELDACRFEGFFRARHHVFGGRCHVDTCCLSIAVAAPRPT